MNNYVTIGAFVVLVGFLVMIAVSEFNGYNLLENRVILSICIVVAVLIAVGIIAYRF